MGGMSWIHWVLVLLVALLLFGGRNKISELMGDFAKGIKSFKKGLSEDEKAEEQPKPDQMKTIDQQSPPTTGAPVAGGAPAGTSAPPDQRKAG
jgi:sec-independent protein translocase protein TatA